MATYRRESLVERSLDRSVPHRKNIKENPMTHRILVADSHETVRRTLVSLLTQFANDWEICAEVSNGKDAVEKARELKPDVVILDLLMRQLDGLTAGSEIRALLPNTILVLYSIYASPSLETDAKQAGFHAVVSKSDGVRLIATIRDALPITP